MKDHEICFIMCINNKQYAEECKYYINHLKVPEGYNTEIIAVENAVSMTAGYNEAMKKSEAKYKVYLHQDTFIINPDFIQDVLMIFQSDEEIGMIGNVGVKDMPPSGVMWEGVRYGMLYEQHIYETQLLMNPVPQGVSCMAVEAIDGFIMITQYDLPWREDIFDKWDFYDASQSMEFIRHGYKVVVPRMDKVWCLHDSGFVNLRDYKKEQRKYVKEYLGGEMMLDGVKIVIVTHNRLEALQQTIESIRTVLQESLDILVVDNHSDDGTIDWLSREGLKYMSCDVQLEGYGCILDMVLEKFIRDEDMLLLQPGIMLLPSCVENMMEALRVHDNIGAVSARIFYYRQEENLMESWKNAYQYSTEHLKDTAFEEIFDLNEEAVLFKNALLRQIGESEEKLFLPDSVMADIAFEGIKGGWQFRKLNCAYCFFIPQGEEQYEQLFGRNVDREYMKTKWGMNYFNKTPNVKLLEMIVCAQETEMNVLEIGCDCGVNLLYIKNKYKNAHLYGVEINPHAAEIASHIAQTQVADIEECALDFEGVQFDYIVFGDVLEHLREPEKIVAYCRTLLNDNGRIIASIPNLMHYSVLWGLLNGYFSYTDIGLLDRTHIHMFTFNEIIRMFIEAGYEVEAVSKVTTGMSPESRQFVDQLLAIAPDAEEFMYTTFQYHVMARK